MDNYQNDSKRLDKAFNDAVKYLAISPRSEKEVKERLYKKGYHKNEVEFAIEKAKGYRYIDDEVYVKSFYDYYKNKYGTKKIKYKLTSEKGIEQKLAENIIEDIYSYEYELEVATRFATNYAKRKKLEKCDIKKATAFLYQKGFDWKIINNAVSTLFDDTFFVD